MENDHHEKHDHSENTNLDGQHSSEMEMHASHSNHVDHHELITPPGSPSSVEHEIHTEHDAHQTGDSHDGHQDHSDHVDHKGHEEMFRKRFWICLVLSIPVLLFSPAVQGFFGFSTPTFPGSQLITPVLSVVVFIYGGVPFIRMAGPEIRTRKPGMMTLITLAIGVAFVYSLAAYFFSLGPTFFWELVTLIDVMLLGHWLEMRSVRQASGALNELAKLMPDTAERIQPDGSTEEVSANDLRNGDIVLIRPGSSVPADSVVMEGESDVNEAMITGESKPVKKTPGDKVIGGTINSDGSLRARVEATGDETALAGIMRLVEEAQQSKSDTQILADKAAGWLFYIAVGFALLTGIAWTIAIGFSSEVIARVATILVIACPHALGLAIPLVVSITTSLGAKNGILVRDRLALEEAREVNIVIFDKTGTLTKGEFGVVGISTVDGWEDDQALAYAAGIEGDSEHTIARGIRKSAEERKLTVPDVSEFEAIKGRGVKGVIDGQTGYIGGPRMLEYLKIDLPEKIAQFETQAGEKGQSVANLIVKKEVIASFAVADVIRPESKQAVDKLHDMGIEVAMLTGDSKAVAKAVSDELGIDQYFAEVLPEHKDQKVAELQAQGKSVAMVGDGVNDAPALTRANVGIAIGSGTDVAVESADIILVKNNPSDVVNIFTLSNASYKKMKENLIWATGYNVVALPLAAGILAPWGFLLSPAVGALFMSLSTVIVAINAQTLRRMKFSTK
ncbi:MAG: heavy metal translocating P-type ATPase [Anaerolineales bacterium]|nr:heavy metal translocating P-type ATPase [Anaerolineales bacterium]